MYDFKSAKELLRVHDKIDFFAVLSRRGRTVVGFATAAKTGGQELIADDSTPIHTAEAASEKREAQAEDRGHEAKLFRVLPSTENSAHCKDNKTSRPFFWSNLSPGTATSRLRLKSKTLKP